MKSIALCESSKMNQEYKPHERRMIETTLYQEVKRLRWVIQILLNGLALFLVASLLPSVHIQGIGTAVLAALILGVVNALVRPLLVLLTLPLTFLTFGLFLLVINALTFAMTAWMLPSFQIDGLAGAFWGALLMSLFSWVLNAVTLRILK